MLDDLRREVDESPRMLLAARVGVGYFNRLMARRLLRACVISDILLPFPWSLLLRNTRIQHHQSIGPIASINNNVLLHNLIRHHKSHTAVAVGT